MCHGLMISWPRKLCRAGAMAAGREAAGAADALAAPRNTPPERAANPFKTLRRLSERRSKGLGMWISPLVRVVGPALRSALKERMALGYAARLWPARRIVNRLVTSKHRFSRQFDASPTDRSTLRGYASALILRRQATVVDIPGHALGRRRWPRTTEAEARRKLGRRDPRAVTRSHSQGRHGAWAALARGRDRGHVRRQPRYRARGAAAVGSGRTRAAAAQPRRRSRAPVSERSRRGVQLAASARAAGGGAGSAPRDGGGLRDPGRHPARVPRHRLEPAADRAGSG